MHVSSPALNRLIIIRLGILSQNGLDPSLILMFPIDSLILTYLMSCRIILRTNEYMNTWAADSCFSMMNEIKVGSAASSTTILHNNHARRRLPYTVVNVSYTKPPTPPMRNTQAAKATGSLFRVRFR